MRCTEAFASATVFVVTDFFCFSFFSFNSFASLSLSLLLSIGRLLFPGNWAVHNGAATAKMADWIGFDLIQVELS